MALVTFASRILTVVTASAAIFAAMIPPVATWVETIGRTIDPELTFKSADPSMAGRAPVSLEAAMLTILALVTWPSAISEPTA